LLIQHKIRALHVYSLAPLRSVPLADGAHRLLKGVFWSGRVEQCGPRAGGARQSVKHRYDAANSRPLEAKQRKLLSAP
jgi:hypothetical protein